MQPYPRSPHLVWPGQLHGTGCLSVRALDTGFPTVVWCLCLGLGCGRLWVSVTLPSPGWGLGQVCLGAVCGVVPLLRVGVCGVRGWAWVLACTPPVVVGDMGRAWLRARSACTPPFPVLVCGVGVRAGVLVSAASGHSLGGVGVCVCSCARPAWFPATPGWGCCAGMRACARALLVPRLSWLGCAVWACVLGPGLGCAPHFLVELSGCVFFLRVLLWLCGVGRWLSLSRALWSLSPHALSFRLGCWLFFFFRPSVVCFCTFWVSLPPVGRCSWLGVAGFGWVVPLCSFGGPVFGAFRPGGLAAPCGVGGRFGGCGGCGPFSRPNPPSPPVFFWGGGSACSSLCLPWAGARTGRHSVWSSGLLLAVAFCLAASRPHGSAGLCTRWARRPFVPG